MLGITGVGVAREDLGVSQRYDDIRRVDDPQDHSVGVAAVDRLCRSSVAGSTVLLPVTADGTVESAITFTW
jgi:hypothetical protein